jgi:hypothetical protein
VRECKIGPTHFTKPQNSPTSIPEKAECVFFRKEEEEEEEEEEEVIF